MMRSRTAAFEALAFILLACQLLRFHKAPYGNNVLGHHHGSHLGFSRDGTPGKYFFQASARFCL